MDEAGVRFSVGPLMKYKFFTTSEKSWKVMLGMMSLAQESIYLEMYIFSDDMDQFNFFEVLERKAKEGVRVRMILDSFGSLSLSNDAVAKLRASGAEIIFLSKFLHRLHRKILIIDEQVAFLGGVNIHKSAARWTDLMVKIEGKIVERIVRLFAQDYVNAGGQDRAVIAKNKKVFFHKAQTWVVNHSPLKKKFGLKNVYKKHINEAKTSVVLVTPYFMPKRWLLAHLHQAVLRGVEVNILVPKSVEESFYNIMNKANYFYMHKAQKLGVRFYLEPFMNHAKLMLIDDKEGVVGSQNLDFLSFELNSEIGVFFKDKNTVGKLESIVAKWKSQSVPFEAKDYKPSWIDHIISHFLNFFIRFL